MNTKDFRRATAGQVLNFSAWRNINVVTGLKEFPSAGDLAMQIKKPGGDWANITTPGPTTGGTPGSFFNVLTAADLDVSGFNSIRVIDTDDSDQVLFSCEIRVLREAKWDREYLIEYDGESATITNDTGASGSFAIEGLNNLNTILGKLYPKYIDEGDGNVSVEMYKETARTTLLFATDVVAIDGNAHPVTIQSNPFEITGGWVIFHQTFPDPIDTEVLSFAELAAENDTVEVSGASVTAIQSGLATSTALGYVASNLSTVVDVTGFTYTGVQDANAKAADIQSRIPTALDGDGFIKSRVKAMDTGIITADAIGADAIGSSELATSAAEEIGGAGSATMETAQAAKETDSSAKIAAQKAALGIP